MSDDEIPLAEVEEGLARAAWIVANFGEQYAPIMYRLEAEVRRRRSLPSAADRARAILETHAHPGTTKAIR